MSAGRYKTPAALPAHLSKVPCPALKLVCHPIHSDLVLQRVCKSVCSRPTSHSPSPSFWGSLQKHMVRPQANGTPSGWGWGSLQKHMVRPQANGTPSGWGWGILQKHLVRPQADVLSSDHGCGPNPVTIHLLLLFPMLLTNTWTTFWGMWLWSIVPSLPPLSPSPRWRGEGGGRGGRPHCAKLASLVSAS